MSAAETSVTDPKTALPALWTSTVGRPRSRVTRSNVARTARESLTSVGYAAAPSISEASAARESADRASIATR
jgi:hypothetical protein